MSEDRPGKKHSAIKKGAISDNIIDFVNNELIPNDVNSKLDNPANRFGKYVLIEKRGEGGSGVVYKAYDTKLNSYVALKIMNSSVPEMVVRFRREANLIANLRHPNIVPIHEAGEYDGRPYISMQFIEGMTLNKFSDKFTDKQLIEIFIRICDALNEAHKNGIIHRDIKPENILIDDKGWVFVVDFGIAKQLNTDMTVTKDIIGTPQYMSPEQIRDQDVDVRTDVYSLGATIYDCLSNVAPFSGDSSYDIVVRVIETDPVPMRKINNRIKSEIEHIVMKCMEKDPNRRYQDIADLQQDLMNFLSGDPVQANSYSIIYRLRKKLAKRKSIVLAGLMVALVALGTYIYSIMKLHNIDIARRNAAAYLEEGTQSLRKAMYAIDPDSIIKINDNIENAITNFTQAIALDGTLADAYLNRAECYFMSGSYETAIENLDKAVTINPKLIEVYFRRIIYKTILLSGFLFYSDDEPPAKIAAFIDESKEDLKSLKQISASETIILTSEAAIQVLESIFEGTAELNGDDWTNYVLATLDQAIDKDPTIGLTFLLRGTIRFKVARSVIHVHGIDDKEKHSIANDALNDIMRSVELGIVEVRILELSAELFQTIGKYDEAIKCLKLLQGHRPEEPLYLLFEAKNRILAGSPEIAGDLLRESSQMDLSRSKSEVHCYMKSGEVWLMIGNKEAADNEFNKALSGSEGDMKFRVEEMISHLKSLHH